MSCTGQADGPVKPDHDSIKGPEDDGERKPGVTVRVRPA